MSSPPFIDDKLLPEQEAFKSAIEERVERLTTALCEELERPALRRNAIRATVYMLLRLGKADEARSKYLLNWSNAIQRDIKCGTEKRRGGAAG